MKRFLSFLAAAGLMLGFVACVENKEGDDPVTPEFPKVTEQALAASGADAGFEYTATLNVPWTLTLTDNAEGHFLMTENGQNVDSVNGTANASKKVVVYATAEPAPGEAFECTLTMAATGTTESAVVARIKHSAAPDAGYSFELHVGYLDSYGSWEYAPEGGFAYTEEAVAEGGTIELLMPWGSGAYMLPVQIIADAGWAMTEMPEWLNNTEAVTNEETGAVTFRFEAANYEIAEPEGQLTFSYGDGTTFTYTVTIPDYGKFLDMEAGGTKSYDADGNLTNSENVSSIIATAGLPKVVTFTKVVETGSSYYEAGADWFTVDIELYDEDEAENYICDWKPVITVEANPTTTAREGLVMILPWYALEALAAEGATEETLADYLAGNEVNPDYADYVYANIVQEGQPMPELFTVYSMNDELANLGVYFSDVTNGDGWYKNNMTLGRAQYFYQLVYTSEYNNDDGVTFELAGDFAEQYAGKMTLTSHDANGVKYDVDYPWLDTRIFGMNQDRFAVDMYPDDDDAAGQDEDYEHVGYVMVYLDGVPTACIQCIYDPDFANGDDQPGVGGENGELVSFVSEDDRPWWAELRKLDNETLAENLGIGKDLYLTNDAQGITQYVLSYFDYDPDTDVTLNIPEGYHVMYMPYNNNWLSTDLVPDEYSVSTMTVKMEAPEEGSGSAADGDNVIGCIQFADKNFNNVVFIYCRPVFAW